LKVRAMSNSFDMSMVKSKTTSNEILLENKGEKQKLSLKKKEEKARGETKTI